MNQAIETACIEILKKELVPALGCTEPIALAYCGAKTRSVLGFDPDRVNVYASGNVVKNVKAVTVPNSGNRKGIDTAVMLGMFGGDDTKELEVLSTVTDKDIERALDFIKDGRFRCEIEEGAENLYIRTEALKDDHKAAVEIIGDHTNITKIEKDGTVLYCRDPSETEEGPDYGVLDIRAILDFAQETDLSAVKDVLQRQIDYNTAIASEGLKGEYGASVGRTLLDSYGNSVAVRARAMAAAGSDARMSGCGMPVVINSGSGNQGITVSMPVIEYAKQWNKSEEELLRALIISNLVSIHIKHLIGSLSAFCGAVTAACGAGAAITWLAGNDYETVCRTIVNTLANVSGIVCDGAKPSCAAKIASAVDAAILGWNLSRDGKGFHGGEGLIKDSIEETIQSIAWVGRVGMKETDREILDIMLERVNFND